VFRQVPNDRHVVAALEQELASRASRPLLIALAQDTTAYGSGAAQVFIDALSKAGLAAPIVSVSFDYGATDFTGQLQRIRQAAPTVVVVAAYETEAGLFTKQARQLGLDQPIYATVGGFKEFRDPAGTAADGVVFTARFLAVDPATKDFTDRFVAANSFEPTDSASGAYLATLALADAFVRAGPGSKGPALRDAIRATNLKTAVGTAAWDGHGDLKEPNVLVGINQGGKPVILRRLTQPIPVN
jgi:branched-chain amino acid transport system substrate-binding protein